MIVNSLETEFVAISQQLRSITVEISNHRSGGSGVIWSPEGLVITNAHVVRGSTVQVKLSNGAVREGNVIACAPQQDLAAIQIKIEVQDKIVSDTIIGNSQRLRPGEIVFAMGSPWGFSETLTTGIIHATQWRAAPKNELKTQQQSNNTPTALILAALRLAPGNSGGVLANVRGEVIGVNVAIYNGLALAIPSQQVEEFIKTIAR